MRSYFFHEEMFEGLEGHGVVVLALRLVQEPAEQIVRHLGAVRQTVPQHVHLLQAQPCKTLTLQSVTTRLLL